MGVLSAVDVRGWRIRVPQLLIAWGLPLTVFASFFLPYTPGPEKIEEVLSWQVTFGSVLSATSFFAAFFAWINPRTALWVFVTCCLTQGLIPGHPTFEFSAGVGWGVIAIVDAILAKRQESIALRWPGPEEQRASSESVRTATVARRWSAPTVAAISLVAGIAVIGWWIDARAELADLDTRAESRTASVSEVDTAFDYISFRFAGEEFERSVWDASDYEVGQQITVRVDPSGEFDPLGPEDADPQSTNGLGPLAAPLLLLAALRWWTPRHRRRARVKVAEHAGPVQAFVEPVGSKGATRVRSADGRALALVTKVVTVGQPVYAQDDLDDSAQEAAAHLGYPARVYGLSRYGKPVLIEVRTAGATLTLVGMRPIRDPFTTRYLLARLFRRS